MGTAAALVILSEMFFGDLGLLARLEVPFMILAAGEEQVVDPSAGEKMMAATVRVPQAQKRLLVVDGALHGIFSEPEPRRAAAETAARRWVREGVAGKLRSGAADGPPTLPSGSTGRSARNRKRTDLSRE